MTVSSTAAFSGPYLGNGSTTAFPWTFDSGSTAEVQVRVDGVVTASGFTKTRNADGSGTVTFSVAPASGTKIIIESNPSFTQEVGFTNAGRFLPETHDEALDDAARRDIYLRYLLSRTALAAPGRSGVTVSPSDQGGIIGVDADGDLVVLGPGAFIGPSGTLESSGLMFVTPQQFGAVADDENGTGTNSGPAFAAAIAYLKSIALDYGSSMYQASPRLYVPAGAYYLGTTTLDINHTFIIEGEGVGGAGSVYASRLRWAAGATGIRTQRHDTIGATATIASGLRGGDNCIIRGLWLQGGYAGTEGEFHGIHMRSRATILDCAIKGWQGDGIYSLASTGVGAPFEGNANLVVIERCTVSGNRRGLFLDGADANAGTIIACDFSGNRTWGVDDSSFLGNTYVGCHASGNGWDGALGSIPTACTFSGNRYAVIPGQEAGASTNAPSGTTADNTWWTYIAPGGVYNGVVPWVSGTTFRAGGPFRTDNANAANVLVGCYTEGDQNPAFFDGRTRVDGGLLGAGFRGGSVVEGNQGSLRITGAKAENYRLGAYGPYLDMPQPNLPLGRIGWNLPSGSNVDFQGFFGPPNTSIALTTLNSAVNTNWWLELLLDGTANPVGARRVNFPNGFGLADKKVQSGTAAPASGTYVQGDMVFNSAPSAGGPMGWMCVTAGSPGTWKAMPNLAA